MPAQGRHGCRMGLPGLALFSLFCLAGVFGPALLIAAAPGVDDVRFRTLGVDDGLSQASGRALIQGAEGFIWIGTQDGLNRFDGFRFDVFQHDPTDPYSLSDNHIVALAIDTEQVLWVATQSGGLNRFDSATGRFQRIVADGPEGLVSNVLVDVKAGPDGRLWVQAEQRQLQWLNPGESLFQSAGHVTGKRLLAIDADGGVFLARGDGLYRWAPSDEQAMPLGHLGYPGVHSSYGLVGEDAFWVGTENHGIFQLDRQGHIVRHWHHEPERLATGLLDNQVRSLMQDRHGHIWAGTVSGLSRIDLETQQVRSWPYVPGDSLGLSGARVVSLLEDQSGLIWAGNWTGGINVFDPETSAFTLIRHRSEFPSSLPGNAIPAVLENADGSLWVSLLDAGGLARFDPVQGLLERHIAEPGVPGRLPHRMVSSVMHDGDDGLLVGTLGGGLVRLDLETRRFERLFDPPDQDIPRDALVESLYRDTHSTLWVSTVGAGLFRLCQGCPGFEQFGPDPADPHSLSDTELNGVLEAADGSFWVATRRQGLNRLDRSTGRFERFNTDNSSLRHNAITGLYQARDGQIWLGTQGGGVHRMALQDGKPEFTAIGRAEGLNADAIGEIAEDPEGRIWVSTTAGLSRIDQASLRVENFPFIDGRSGAGFFIGSIDRPAPDRVWFGGVRGLVRVDFDRVDVSPPLTEVVLTDLLLFNQLIRPGEHPALGQRLAGLNELRLSHDLNVFTLEFVAPGNLRHSNDLRYAFRLEGLDRDWIETTPDRAFATYTVLPAGEYRFQVRAGTRSGDWGEPTELPIRILPPPWLSPMALLAYLLGSLLLTSLLIWRVHLGLARRRRSQEVIAASQQRLRMALWGSRDELWEADILNNHLVRENRIDQSVPDVEALRTGLDDFWAAVHPDDLAAVKQAFVAHAKGRSDYFEAEFRLRWTHGGWLWMLARGRATRRDDDGRTLVLSGTARDISSIKETEQALLRLNEELESRVSQRTLELETSNQTLTQAMADLKAAQHQLVQTEKLAALGGLVAGVAHEINTPLGVGVTAASHLENEARRMISLFEQNEAVSREAMLRYSTMIQQGSQLILRNLRRADQMVRSFKQVAVDQSSEQRRQFDLAVYMEEILTSLHPEIKRRRHQVTTNIPAGLEFDSYPGALYQVIVNLVMNGLIHAFEEGQVGRIHLEATAQGDTVRLRYHDDGRGMTSDVAERIFDPFFTTRRGQGGSGLGLHIVYNLVTQVLDGNIRYKTAPGEGLQFDIELPQVAGRTQR